MNFKLLSTLAVVLGMVVSCNRNSANNDPVDNAREMVKDASIQERTFRGECQAKPINEIVTGLLTLGEAAVKSQRIQYRFTGANVSRVTHLYAMADCTGEEAFSFEESGELRIHEDQKTADSATFVDFDYRKVELTISSQAGVVIANRIGVCNMTNWNVNDRRDITPAAPEVTCYNVVVPRMEYNIYRIDNDNTLYFGTHEKSNSPDTRPGSVKTELKYVAE
ncbi:MAG: hypothetical protein JNL11_01460 [Bdellovibrionaceae bacterium]|nr:hypothetical protein [Pseudobdellovibrionaceae bacterium]